MTTPGAGGEERRVERGAVARPAGAPLSRATGLHQAGLHHGSWLALALLAAFPFAMQALDQPFYLSMATRMLIFAIAATSLNFILGFGGMVSFGHAAFVGLGAYTVGILAGPGLTLAWVAWPVAALVGALAAAVVGAISLRTRGVYFIMITLAFAQMFYYLFVSLRAWGGDDGLPLEVRSIVGGPVDLRNDLHFYLVVLLLFAAVLGLVRRLVNAPFGRMLQAARENEERAQALGVPVFRLRWLAFVIAGAVAGLAGALLANQNGLVTPHTLHWSQSGQLMVMVILGGAGRLYGGVIGAAVLVLLEELLTGHTLYWQMALGVVLLAVVLFAPGGLSSLWRGRRLADEDAS